MRFRLILGCSAALALAAPVRAARYLCFGDSNTGGHGGDRATYLGVLGDYLSTAVGPTEMINQGIGGETTLLGQPRLRSLVNSNHYDYVLIMEGTNDVTRWILEPTLITPGQTETNLRRMVRDAKGSGAIVILATVVPRVGSLIDPRNDATRQLNGIIRRVAGDEGAVLAEVFQSVQAVSSDLIYEDEFHPNDVGYALVAEAFGAVITNVPVGSLDLTPPIPVDVSPAPGSRDSALDADISIVLYEVKHPITAAAVTMTVDGQPVVPAIDTSRADRTRIEYAFPEHRRFGERVEVSATIADSNVPGNELALDYTYTATAGNGSGGDIDRSGRVDGADLAVLAKSFGVGRRDRRYDFAADIDASGFVDGFDLAVLSQAFGSAP